VPGGEGALTFGDLTDPDSEVRAVLDRHHTIARRISLGTGPNVYYIV
jgi:molybdopterin-containing oxidoreductase family iron-sulfur binding subunit